MLLPGIMSVSAPFSTHQKSAIVRNRANGSISYLFPGVHQAGRAVPRRWQYWKFLAWALAHAEAVSEAVTPIYGFIFARSAGHIRRHGVRCST